MQDVQNTLDEMIHALAPGQQAPTDILTTRHLYRLRRRLADLAFRSGDTKSPRISRRQLKCGVAVVDLRNGQVTAFLEFLTAVNESFDVQLLSGLRFPEVIGFQQEPIQHRFVVPPVPRAPLRSADVVVSRLGQPWVPADQAPG